MVVSFYRRGLLKPTQLTASLCSEVLNPKTLGEPRLEDRPIVGRLVIGIRVPDCKRWVLEEPLSCGNVLINRHMPKLQVVLHGKQPILKGKVDILLA